MGTEVRRLPDGPLLLPGPGPPAAAGDVSPGRVRFLDGCTLGASPACLSKCGGQGASGSPSTSCRLASSSSGSSDRAASSMPRQGSPISAKRRGTVSMVRSSGRQAGTSPPATGVLLYLRFHHAPFQVTGAAITRQAPNGCGVNVTGQVTTNGSAGTV